MDKIEWKIQEIENELKKNHETIVKIKEMLSDLSKGDNVNVDKLKVR